MTLHKGRSSLPTALLIVGSSFFLLFNPGWLEWVASWLPAAVFLAAGALFLGFLGAGFAAVCRAEQRWGWALLPAGVLWTLALVAWLGETRPGFEVGWVFFLELLGALALALLVFVSSGGSRALFPPLLIAGGVFLLRRSGRRIDDPLTLKGI